MHSVFCSPSTLKLRLSHSLSSPTACCDVGVVTLQASKESMYRHTTSSLVYSLPDILSNKLQVCRRRFDHMTRHCTNFITERVKFTVSRMPDLLVAVFIRQTTAASCPIALGALCDQLTFRLAWCREHSIVTTTELLQPRNLAFRTFFWSSCAIPDNALGLFKHQLKGRYACYF